MAGDGTSFDIDLSGLKGAAAVTAAADGVTRLDGALQAAVTSATAAASAVTAGETAYKQAEAAANKAALSVEKIGLASDAAKAKLALLAAGTDGVVNVAAYRRAQEKVEQLATAQQAAATKATAASAAMTAEAVALDKLKASSAGAAAAQSNISEALDKAKAKAAAATKALQATSKPVDAGAAAGALGKLGGPLGAIGQKAFDGADAFKKMGQSLGSAGPYVAVAVALVAVATGVAAVAAAVAVGVGGITLWAIKLADADGQIDKLVKRGTAGFKKIFSGLNIKPLLGELSKVADLFDEGSASAKAIKTVFESLFQPIVNGLTGLVPVIIRTFILFEIQVLKALIAIKPFGSTILEVGKWIGIVALVIGGVLAVAIGAVVIGVAAMAVGFGVLIALFGAVVVAIGYVINKVVDVGIAIFGSFGSAIDYLKSLSLTEIGTQMIDGLVAGITEAGPKVLKSITGIADGAISAAKKALGIASPSKIFAEIGMNTAAGMEQGVDGEAASVQGSLESLVSPPDAPGAAAPAAAGAGGGHTFYVTVTGVGDAKATVDAFSDWFFALGAQAGTAVPDA